MRIGYMIDRLFCVDCEPVSGFDLSIPPFTLDKLSNLCDICNRSIFLKKMNNDHFEYYRKRDEFNEKLLKEEKEISDKSIELNISLRKAYNDLRDFEIQVSNKKWKNDLIKYPKELTNNN